MSDFRGRLQEAADFAGVGGSQTAMAASLKLKKQTVNNWVQGVGQPNAEMLLRIARAWGVDPEWLKTGKGDKLPSPPDDLPQDELELLRDYRKASYQARTQIRTMVRALRKSVVTLAAVIPPLMAPPPADAASLHNYYFAIDLTKVRIAFRRWIERVSTMFRHANLALVSSL